MVRPNFRTNDDSSGVVPEGTLMTQNTLRARLRALFARVEPLSRAELVALEDIGRSHQTGSRPFSMGSRPVIRWVKGDGLDDPVTRSAIGAATRLFGSEVDYCLCTNGIDAGRVRNILSWATQPVEWWQQDPDDNTPLAALLHDAACTPDRFGYWWKWFPERVRPNGPEWILDGDMVLTSRPPWYDRWMGGTDPCRISQDDSMRYYDMYGGFGSLVDREKAIYSGLVSLPPGQTYMGEIRGALDRHPLAVPHDGTRDMDEQGAVAMAFDRIGAVTFPLSEFPFARAFEEDLDFGRSGTPENVWGYHFGHAFREPNHHFDRLVAEGVIHSQPEPRLSERFTWLGNFGQWGIPGWSMPDGCTDFILGVVQSQSGDDVLELGTSRGRMTAMLCTLGKTVTTLDHVDRGASVNLNGLDAEVITTDALQFLLETERFFSTVIVDIHDNSEARWRVLLPGLVRVVRSGGVAIVSNAQLYEIPEWVDETGVRWALENLPSELSLENEYAGAPGVAVLRRA